MHRTALNAARERRIADLYRAAVEVFDEVGVDKVTLSDIVRHAGFGAAQIQLAGSRDAELWDVPLMGVIAKYFLICEDFLAGTGPSAADRLAALVRATVAYYLRYTTSAMLLRQRTLLQAGQRLTVGDEASVRGATRMFRDVIDQGLREGSFRTPFPSDARRGIEAACNSILEWYDAQGPIGPQELADRYVHLAFVLVEYSGVA